MGNQKDDNAILSPTHLPLLSCYYHAIQALSSHPPHCDAIYLKYLHDKFILCVTFLPTQSNLSSSALSSLAFIFYSLHAAIYIYIFTPFIYLTVFIYFEIYICYPVCHIS